MDLSAGHARVELFGPLPRRRLAGLSGFQLEWGMGCLTCLVSPKRMKKAATVSKGKATYKKLFPCASGYRFMSQSSTAATLRR